MRSLPPLVRWTRSSTVLLSGFFLVVLLIVYLWWPLAHELLSYIDWRGPWWLYLDWLLIGLFAFMSFSIVARADLRRDALILFVATVGGLVIEAWGTQTNLWHYYTSERPPLWIIPAWPIATLSIDRITRFLDFVVDECGTRFLPRAPRAFIFNFKHVYWAIFALFLTLMFTFVAPTFNKPYTLMALALCLGLVLTPTDHRRAVLVFIAGVALGYFLELWGTTRECWTYYTLQTPPVFAVLAHGMAAVSFWRGGLLTQSAYRLFRRLPVLVPRLGV
jgi:hypothetical protein